MTNIEEFSTDELLKELRKRDKKTGQSFVTEGLFNAFKEHGIPVVCPKCGSENMKEHDKTPNGTIRYKCKECKTRFVAAKDTIFEGTDFSWDEMVQIVDGLLYNDTYRNISRKLQKPESVIWLIAMKIYDVVSHFETPTLNGNIQIDETYVRENQKGSSNLVSLTGDENRIRRKHYIASKAGIKGPEWINVVCAVDSSGLAYAKCVSYGILTVGYLDDLKKHLGRVDYICTDDLSVYSKWCHINGWKHYIEPSKYRKERTARGYITTDDIGRTLTDEERKISNQIAREMYEEGVYPRIENAGVNYSYDDFNTIHYKFNLHINSVGSLHDSIKDMLYAENGGVKDAYLPLYLAWHIYKHNYRKIKNIGTLQKTDAENILVEIVKWTKENHYSITRTEIQNKILDIPKTNAKETKDLISQMSKAREIIITYKEDKYGRRILYEGFDEEYIFNKYKFFQSMRAKRLNELCKYYNIKATHKKDKVKELCSREDAQEIIWTEIFYSRFKSTEELQEFLSRKPQKKKRGRPKKNKNTSD